MKDEQNTNEAVPEAGRQINSFEMQEQFRDAAIKRCEESGIGWCVFWHLRPYDGTERCWEGYIDGVLAYTVHRGGYFFHLADPLGPDYGDACESEQIGMNCCEAHALYGADWPRSKQSDPILSQDGDEGEEEYWYDEAEKGKPSFPPDGGV
jgi:hypothetical protein